MVLCVYGLCGLWSDLQEAFAEIGRYWLTSAPVAKPLLKDPRLAEICGRANGLEMLVYGFRQQPQLSREFFEVHATWPGHTHNTKFRHAIVECVCMCVCVCVCLCVCVLN